MRGQSPIQSWGVATAPPRVPKLIYGTSGIISYTGPVSSPAWNDRGDATGGSAINTDTGAFTGGPFYYQKRGDYSFTLSHYFVFFDEVIELDDDGKLATWINVGDRRWSGRLYGAIHYSTHLISEQYDAAFAWDNPPARIAGTDVLIWDVDGTEIGLRPWMSCGNALWYMLLIDIPKDVSVWGIEISTEAYIGSSVAWREHYMGGNNVSFATAYPFCTNQTVKPFRWYGLLRSGETRLERVPWICGDLSQ